MTRVAGVDVTKGKWVAVVLENGLFERAVVASTLNNIFDELGCVDVLTLDIPIGLPSDDGDWPRACDLEARAMLKPRWQVVFLTPPRAVLETGAYAEANELHRSLTGKGLSRQSWGLQPKILEADVFAAGHGHVVEAHPECSFRALKGAPLSFSKKTWNGQIERRQILHSAGIDLPDQLPGDAGRVPPDDILDAAAAAWSAHRVATGDALKLGEAVVEGPGPRAGMIWI